MLERLSFCYGLPHNRCLSALGMQSQRALDLSCANSVTADIDDVIHSACDPVVAVLVPSAAIS